MLDQAQSKAHFSSRRQMTNNFRLFPLSFPLKLKKFKERLYVHMFDTYVCILCIPTANSLRGFISQKGPRK